MFLISVEKFEISAPKITLVTNILISTYIAEVKNLRKKWQVDESEAQLKHNYVFMFPMQLLNQWFSNWESWRQSGYS